jgi:putative tricarboxylic transport membrane protein
MVSPGVVFRFALPLAAALTAWALARFFIAPGVDVEGMSRGLVGPATWPKVMLYGAAACALGLFLCNAYSLFGRQPAASGKPAAAGYRELRSICAIALLAGYGVALPYLGFAWTTLAFLCAWLLLGGVRRLRILALVPTLGTIALLYVFVKLSLMPLNRGQGIFEQATIGLYRLLGIF